MRLHFEVASGSAGARSGTLVLDRGEQDSVQMQTPSFFKYTRHGMQPHLVPDVAAEVTGLPAVTHVQLEDFLDERPTEQRHFAELRKFAGIGLDAVVLDVLDPTVTARAVTSAEKFMGVDSEGGVRRLTPAAFARAVNALDADVAVAPADYVHEAQPSLTRGKRISKSVARSARWLDEALAGITRAAVFAPVMGSLSPELRDASARALSTRSDVAGYALSDVALAPSDRLWAAQRSLPLLDAAKPRYMAGASAPDMVLRAVLSGVDLVDSSYAYAVTEQGLASAYTLGGDGTAAHVDLWQDAMAADFGPLVAGCTCFACRSHHRAYLHHLLRAREMLATVLLQAHNLHWYARFFADIRRSLAQGSLAAEAEGFFTRYGAGAFGELDLLATQACSPTTKIQRRRHA
ncbi:hypothetical protein IWW55_003042 [Coemansia sp. RSA 2706]|nr:hypothetical protein IWW55_003042 [Coemansia sp. RSA 2706]KAJ2370749.1 hypothetical protein H4S01_000128 [Coemansia sp. RSA 2610]KAJ2384620.1 hypothetical protein H4S02_004729 [Coemansia sp. RSA 2611]